MKLNLQTIQPLIDLISDTNRSFEKTINPLIKRQTGSYYTPINLTIPMMREIVSSFTKEELCTKTFLEPCVGTGNYVFGYLFACWELNLSTNEIKAIINNIYVCDINNAALQVYRDNLMQVASKLFNITLDEEYFKTHIGRGLLFDVNSANTEYIPITERFSTKILRKGFDIIATNPPYKILKAESSQYEDTEEFLKDKQKYKEINDIALSHFHFSTTGILNIYKLFVEEILDQYLAPSGICSLLIPSSILSDKTCSKLRTHIIDTCRIETIHIIEENNSYISSSQAMCSLLLKKGEKTDSIKIIGSCSNSSKQETILSIDDIRKHNTGNAILVLTPEESIIRQKMQAQPKIADLDYIVNLRGELDITLNKNSITNKPTKYKFYRGKNIGYYKTIESIKTETEYVVENFVQNSAKKIYIFKPRLVCQQVVNMSKKKRISFTLIPENCVLGNSCNFVSILPNKDGIDEYYLLGLLNSTLIEWYFKLTSSNNHINNYEIDSFPIPINFDKKKQLSKLVKIYLESHDDKLLTQIDALVYEAYGITKEKKSATMIIEKKQISESIFKTETALIESFFHDVQAIIPSVTLDECVNILNGYGSVVELIFQKHPTISSFDRNVLDCIERKYKKIHSGEILNHTTFSLSKLDMEMIKSVPQGGSWKNIPQETVQKSKRLLRITQTGGRTTLYGRIDYNKPAYTITTYFNRPGNGTYIHPTHNRVLSVREAARFQTFPDKYFFQGNKTDMLKEVGNAVPVLLAYNIGKAITEKTNCSTSVDLFSGAGGMTYGFKLAGIKTVIANDFFENACITLKVNSPEIPVLCGDITDNKIKQKIIEEGKRYNADIICGGPPCQGFSLAGFRKDDDPRNQLFHHFVDIVSQVNPKVIVFENVEGLLSYKNGETYKNIIELFSQLGYNTEGRTLVATNYGVPQKRKRVIILCTRKDINIMPSDLYPDTITPLAQQQISAYDTIYDLESVVCDDHAMYVNNDNESLILQYFKDEITIEDYFKELKMR